MAENCGSYSTFKSGKALFTTPGLQDFGPFPLLSLFFLIGTIRDLSPVLLNHFQFISMPILTVMLVLVAVGVALWLINRYIPMQSTIKSLLNAVVVIVVVIWLLKVFGVWDNLQHLHT